ncbi:MAG TPA: archaeosortase/exosortase family protein [Thermoplasmata archaeon]|nr:archaeosortase/exosortase family protein [Thermoplasmata archaeon]
MGLERWTAYAERHRSVVGLTALLVTFGAVALVLDRPKGAAEMWLALPLFAAGAALFAWVLWPAGRPMAVAEPTLATRLIRFLSLRGRLTKVFPVAGVAVVAGDLAYNFLVSTTPAFLTEDIIVLLLGAALLAYGFVPEGYARERDFVLMFFLALNAILVVPLLAARAYFQDFDTSVDVYSWVALAPETGAVLSLLGVPNVVHSLPGVTAPAITFTPQQIGLQVTLVITTACSGIYSFGIFASAFLSFVLTEYARPSRRMWAFLGLGLLAAYVANILRMVIIVLVGYYTDTAATDLQNMLIAHSYAGWIIFLAWTALFWGLLFRFVPIREPEASVTEGRVMSAGRAVQVRYGVSCEICGGALSPAIHAERCTCGAYLHRACLRSSMKCPSCGRRFQGELSQAVDSA